MSEPRGTGGTSVGENGEPHLLLGKPVWVTTHAVDAWRARIAPGMAGSAARRLIGELLQEAEQTGKLIVQPHHHQEGRLRCPVRNAGEHKWTFVATIGSPDPTVPRSAGHVSVITITAEHSKGQGPKGRANRARKREAREQNEVTAHG